MGHMEHDDQLVPNDFRKRDHEAVHGRSLLAPSRSTTPAPPIPKRPESSLYDSSDVTSVIGLDIHGNVEHLSVLGHQQQQQNGGYISGDDDLQQRRRPFSYHPGSTTLAPTSGGLGQKQGLGLGHDRYSSYDYGVPINYRTGASEYPTLDDEVDESRKVKGELRVEAAHALAPTEAPTRPVSSLGQNRVSRQEQMLKRSSQVIPLHHKYNQQAPLTTKDRLHQRNSNQTLVEPRDTLQPQKELLPEEREKLEKVFKKRRSLSEKYGPGGTRVEGETSGSTVSNRSQSYTQDGDGSDGGSILKRGKGRWIDRPCGCLSPGLITFLAFKFSLLYNGGLSAILFQASQFNEVGLTPIFGFTIAYFIATGISALGLITVAILATRNYHTGKSTPSRLPLRVFKLVHGLYLIISVIATTGCMLGWLALNNTQTGNWARMQISPSSSPSASGSTFISSAPLLSIESILKPDPDHPGWLVINPWLWIAVFVGLGLIQFYFWFCMVAYARSHLAQWKSGFQTRMRRLEALRALEAGVVRVDEKTAATVTRTSSLRY
ncbi:hypothetical protein BGX33_006256 [Mortierella sp. NVP41]|nr:hypothetical protein BGX33_006256 [Mortierella sp. NVP41]